MGANCHRAWPRSHSAGATQMPSQSMNAKARPFRKTVLRGAMSPWQTMSPSATAWGPSSNPALEQSPSRCRDTGAAAGPPTPAPRHRASTPRPLLAPTPQSMSASLHHQSQCRPPGERPGNRTLQMREQLPHRLGVGRSRAQHLRLRPGQIRSPSRRSSLLHQSHSPRHKANGTGPSAIFRRSIPRQSAPHHDVGLVVLHLHAS